MSDTDNTLGFRLEGDEESKSAPWIVTFADLITLMLTFFILMYSISNLELRKFKQIMHSIKVSFGAVSVVEDTVSDSQMLSPIDGDTTIQELTPKTRKKNMLKEIAKFIEKRGLHESIEVSLEHEKIVIRVKNKVFFNSGSADINLIAFPILEDIIEIFETYSEFRIDIAGHTDDNPISTIRFPSNWELSTIRATTVLRSFIEAGINPHRLTATGYGEILPIVPNTNEVNRSQNRRVEFILEKSVESLE